MSADELVRGARISRALKAIPLLGVLLGSAALPASSSASCPNETLRSELRSGALPDCRAYELVTPVYKEGQLTNNAFALSEDGDHMIVASLGAFAGAEEDRLGDLGLAGDVYELSRTELGWKASALGPSAERYTSNGMYDASADLGSTLWELGRRSPPASPAEAQANGVTDFYIERTPGAFTEVGPATPPASGVNGNRYIYLGGSRDLSHILYTTAPGYPQFQWSFDKTISSSTGSAPLYEYVGTGNSEPRLVGVKPGAESEGELVSDCGTRLGSSDALQGGGSMYNAISTSGARVFFTAVGADDIIIRPCGASEPQVDELYVREELPGGGLETIPISEPSASYCSGLPSPPCADAHLEGASQDGSKVFFTSTQKLPGMAGAGEDENSGDSAVKGCSITTGAGGCNLYEYEFAPGGNHKLVLVSGGGVEPEGARVQGVARISEDGSHVYFVAKGRLTGKNSEGSKPLAGEDNLYVFERDDRFPEGRISFIATLSPEDEAADWRQEDIRRVQASQNGRFLVFTSLADLTHENTIPGVLQVYQYDAEAGRLVRASIGQGGYNDDGKTPVYGATISALLPAAYAYFGNDSPTQAAGAMAPADGAVFFYSPDALTPQALDDQLDERGEPEPNVYEYRGGSVYLISDGRDTSIANSFPSVELLGSSPSGGDVFFTTSDALINEDTDTGQDIYDARSEGGFAPQSGSPECAEATCLGLPSATPSLPQALAPPAGQAPPSAVAPVRVQPKPDRKRKVKAKRRRRRGKTEDPAARHSRSRARARG